MVITEGNNQNAGLTYLKPHQVMTCRDFQRNLTAPKDIVTLEGDQEPPLTASEYKWLKMIHKEEVKKTFKRPLLLACGGIIGAMLGVWGTVTFGAPAGLAIGLGFFAGTEVGAGGICGLDAAGNKKKEWASIFAKAPESESLKKMFGPYPDLYMKITRGEIA